MSYGEKASRPEKKPEKERCVFVDWYTDNTYATVFNFDSEIKANTTIYAGWGHTVSFYTDSDFMSLFNTQVVLAGKTASKPQTNPTWPESEPETKKVFVDWYTVGDNATKFNFDNEITEDTALIAGWGYTVTFDTGNHGSTVLSQTVREGEKAERPQEPTKEGYSFFNWYTDSTDSAGAMVFDFNTAIEGDITLHAGWTVAAEGSGILYVNNVIKGNEGNALTLDGYLYDLPVLLTVGGQLGQQPSPKQFYSVSYDSKGNITAPASFVPMLPQTVQSYQKLETTEGAYMLTTEEDGSGKTYGYTVDSSTRFYEFKQTGDQASFEAIHSVPSSLSAETLVYLEEVLDAAGSGSTTVSTIYIVVNS